MRRLAARELHRHLALRLDGDGVVEQRLDVFPAQLVHEAHLVGVHEAGVAHHVAAVGQVDGEHRAAAVRDGAGAVLVQLGIVVRADVAARENVFQVLEERRVDGHHVFEVAVDGAVLHHQDLAVALDHLRLDLARLVGVEHFERASCRPGSAGGFPGRSAGTANRSRAASPAAAWSSPRIFSSGLSDHFGVKPGFWLDLVELIEDDPGRAGGVGQELSRRI